MSARAKNYVTPAIETLESAEILELLGPVQGYGPGTGIGGATMGSFETPSGIPYGPSHIGPR